MNGKRWEAVVLAVIPCGVFSSEESAILISGGADGLGQTTALYLSALGYTVFVLSTNNSEPSTPTKASPMSSLPYAWHKSKERSPRASWGIVAPVTLDMHSETQRAHASETVHVYCLNHALHLVALIVLPHPSPALDDYQICRRHMRPSLELGSKQESLAFPAWGKELESSCLEPTEVIRDYFDLLVEAAGRVVMMSMCLPDGTFLHSKSHLDLLR